jgi:hypothetical protein
MTCNFKDVTMENPSPNLTKIPPASYQPLGMSESSKECHGIILSTIWRRGRREKPTREVWKSLLCHASPPWTPRLGQKKKKKKINFKFENLKTSVF